MIAATLLAFCLPALGAEIVSLPPMEAPIAVRLGQGLPPAALQAELSNLGFALPAEARPLAEELLAKGPVVLARSGELAAVLPAAGSPALSALIVRGERAELAPLVGVFAQRLDEYAKQTDPSAASAALARAFDAVRDPSLTADAAVPLSERVRLRVATPRLNFDSEPVLDALERASVRRPRPHAPPSPATESQVQALRAAIAGFGERAAPSLLAWLRFKAPAVAPEAPARRLASLVGEAIARPDALAKPLSAVWPSLSRGALAGAVFLKAARLFGFDFGLTAKGAKAKEALEPELVEFVAAFEEILPIFFGQLRTAVNMSLEDPRRWAPRVTSKDLSAALALTFSPSQALRLDAELDRAYEAFFAEIEGFYKKRGKPRYESFASLMDALIADAPRALGYLIGTRDRVRRGG